MINAQRLNIFTLTAWRPGPLVWIVALAAVVRFINLGGPWLWYDETGSVWMATLPWSNMVAATAGDTHPPLYLALLWVWVRLVGAGSWWVRLPSLVFSLAAIPVAWKVGERLNLSRPALAVAALLMALLPSQIHYAQETRMYSLFQLELWIAVWAILAGCWPVYGIALAAALFTHNYGLIYAPTLTAVCVWQLLKTHGRNDLAKFLEASQPFLWATALAFLAWLPWLAVLRQQMAMVEGGYWLQAVTPGSAVYPLYFMLWGFSPPDHIQTHAALLAFGLVLLVVVKAVQNKSGSILVLAWLLVMPICTAILLSLAWRPVLLFRGVWPSGVALALLVGWALHRTTPARQWVAAFIGVPVLAVCVVGYFLTVGDSKGGALPTAQAIDYRPGDLIVHANEGSMMAIRFYTPTSWPQYLLASDHHNLGELTPATRRAMLINTYPIQDNPTWHRVWLVWAASPTVAEAEDRIIANLLATYPHMVIRDKHTPLVREAVYLLWNHGVGVP